MATAAVIGLTAGKRLLSTSFCPSDLTEKLFSSPDHGMGQFRAASTKNFIVAKRTPNFSQNAPCHRHTQSIKAPREYADASSAMSTADSWFQRSNISANDDDLDAESPLEALLLLQKSMLEKQWILSCHQSALVSTGESYKQPGVTRSGISARQRRTSIRRRSLNQSIPSLNKRKQPGPIVSPELVQNQFRGYVRGTISEHLLSHAEVVNLSEKIKFGLFLEEHKSKLKEKLGFEPSDKQLASSLSMSHPELQSKMIECSLAREKLAMSNVRLVLSIAQKYVNMGAELPDLVQGGLLGLLRGIEKFDSSRGFRISTYAYWWVRQGVSRALVENSKILRLPSHLHERMFSIRNVQIRLEERGVAPSIEKLAECMNMSTKKVRNAIEAVSRVFSLDREAFPSLNGLLGETFHSYIADNHPENNPWHGVDEWSLKEEVNRLLCSTLTERERDIICLYYGLRKEPHTWEDIGKQFGLSRERVRQVGLVALEKLKHAARKKGLEAMLVKH
uniref:RNA polymerase sigma factor rpoD n=1 Tax=Anthurium amnicola TaxID=1678845 RepID=A0A1D1XZQ1_9ARAE